jgi:hypothetical protein
MLDLTELDQLKITGTPELVTVDSLQCLMNYIDPAEEMKQPVHLALAQVTTKVTATNTVCSYGDFSCIVGAVKEPQDFQIND